MRRFEIVQSDTDTTTSHAGFALVGRALHHHTRLGPDLEQIPLRHGIAHADCVTSYVGLMCIGKSDFDAIEGKRKDAFFASALGIGKVPSSPSLRQRFDEHASAMIPLVDKAAVAFIGSVGATVTPIVIKQGTCLARRKLKLTPLDMDVFPMDNSKTKKEGVSYTYKGFNGYAPLAAYLGQEGWCLACELRPGSQHGQKEFIHFLERVVPRAKALALYRLLARLDSGHDAAENRAWFAREFVEFIIKWNPRRQDLEAWLKRAEKVVAHWSFPREGKRVGVFSEDIEETFDGKTRTFRRVVRVIERTIDKHGNRLLVPDIEIEGWWTTLGECECSDEKIIALYCDHATSEQFHSEFKTDLDIERLPSGKFATNDLVMACAVLAYNILRWIGLEGLTGKDAPIRHEATGHLARAAIAAGCDPSRLTLVEMHNRLAAGLQGVGPVVNRDFLECAEEQRGRLAFDAVVMNPPFRRVRAHLAAARALLARGGTLVVLVPITCDVPSARTIEVLPDTTFAAARVRTKIILIGTVAENGD